LLLKTADLSLG
jgi:hypothetical protein